MITIQEIKTELKNAGWKYRTEKVNFMDIGIKYFLHYRCPSNHFKVSFRKDLEIDIIINMILSFIQKNECYFFKKHHVEYGTIDYGINELIEDLRSWL